MKHFSLTSLSLLALLSAGCLSSLARLVGDDDQPTACVARYDPVAPGVDVGHDGCGNYWLRTQVGYAPGDSVECAILSADGVSMIAIRCPASGDTLAVAR